MKILQILIANKARLLIINIMMISSLVIRSLRMKGVSLPSLQMHSHSQFQFKGVTLHIVIIGIVRTTGIV